MKSLCLLGFTLLVIIDGHYRTANVGNISEIKGVWGLFFRL